MKRSSLFGVFLGVAGLLGAQTQGSVEVRTEDGALSRLQTRWNPAPGLEGRWWLKGEGGGSAWVRVQGFQVGPLVTHPGNEGLKQWGPGTDLTSGSWGLGFEGATGGVWAVQTPNRFEAGAQAILDVDPWSAAAGADRTWDLGLPPGDRGPWVDRGRGGVRFQSDFGAAGIEVTGIFPSEAPAGWASRGRGHLRSGPWSLEASGAVSEDPTRLESSPWSWNGGVGWTEYRLGWASRAEDPEGHGEAGWHHGRTGAQVTWGPTSGAGVKGGWEGSFGPFEVQGTGAWSRGPVAWDYSAEVKASVPWEQGKASLSWAVSPGALAPLQTIEPSWSQPGFSVTARWKVEGLRLGWIGPGSSFRLTLSWFF